MARYFSNILLTNDYCGNSLDNRLLHAVGHRDQINVLCFAEMYFLSRFSLAHNHTLFRLFPFVPAFNSAGRPAVVSGTSTGNFSWATTFSSFLPRFLYSTILSEGNRREKKIVEGGCCLPPRFRYQTVWTVSVGLKQRARFCSYLNVLSLPAATSLSLSLSVSLSLACKFSRFPRENTSSVWTNYHENPRNVYLACPFRSPKEERYKSKNTKRI